MEADLSTYHQQHINPAKTECFCTVFLGCTERLGNKLKFTKPRLWKWLPDLE